MKGKVIQELQMTQRWCVEYKGTRVHSEISKKVPGNAYATIINPVGCPRTHVISGEDHEVPRHIVEHITRAIAMIEQVKHGL
ncbi:MAG: hypothetical protein A3F53_01950 [Candidatus Zambryskibacteria bacterium RIFCSPHIGHO2_12_FULL_48_10]|uniref:Uncharacterized protein n=1 Tax=Candidatus Zambryskibacteria bacterium RIFCSPHIGHO2_01_FULL_46_25 TaxID=1802738 RepID=A0A1G2T0U7_9BACT|nr:MAG: hypothetical protein UY30_C0005G0004 [Parcubacteria group bacterium GW2011_GWB1_48_6]OHA90752.1 MAG: hypothetical protein A2838_01120 [Candidatus Zambryskibacteria bacterium RIFCSPHIGHO2_01_FULL_46_25]OHB02126.1 MAG: hypothetical protein A3F53_01950 [Candidatus Zambryskibacteria bacterium RIFCSPHIGHO2_12_FULL_48_10]OHB07222.1 MAG: hypothetical protein A3A31_00255 [Candidatus Zambryskibacteria bacterium RIFCSPLOWO2_01_FULL_48_25]